MRHTMVKTRGLLDDMLMAMKMEIGQSIRSNDASKVYRVAKKWESILVGLIPKQRKR